MDAEKRTDSGSRRHEALANLLILDTPKEQSFDDLAFIAAEVCDVPIALITLLDADRQWFKAKCGLQTSETPIEQSVCRIEIERGEFLDIADLTADERTRRNPLVTGPGGFRAYAGAPLKLTSGVVVGRLCVIDLKPRSEGLDRSDKAILEALARQASEQLELRRSAKLSSRLTELQTALVDIGEAIRRSENTKEMTAATAAIVGQALLASRVGFGMVDEHSEVIDVLSDWTATPMNSLEGKFPLDEFGFIDSVPVRPVVIANTASHLRKSRASKLPVQATAGSLVDMPVRDAGKTIAVLFVHSSAPRHWTQEELSFLRNVADRLEAGVARHRAEQQQAILNGEISHRLKNMLSMIQAIASQTLRGTSGGDAFQNFEQRLMALSAAHDALLESEWTEADLRTVAETVAGTLGFAERIEMDGPAVTLGPRASFALSLILHELLTNAFKYGSLLSSTGSVSLTWSIQADREDELTIVWRETGGPTVIEPSRKGFGSRLIRAGLVGSGGVDIRYEPTGLTAELRASKAQLVAV